MEKQHLKDWKARMNRRIEALRLLKAGLSPVEAAEKLYKGHEENLHRDLKAFRSKDLPFMSEILSAVKDEKLLEGAASSREKMMESRIRNAEQGLFTGNPPTGYRALNGNLIEDEGEISKVDGVLHGFRVLRKTMSKLADEFKLSRWTVQKILRNPVYKGEFVFLGKTYRGNWKPRITPEEYDEIQSMLHAPTGGFRVSRTLYFWKSGKWMARPGAKELAVKIVELRLQRKSLQAIADALGVGTRVVQVVLKDGRVTGTDEFEQLVPVDKWNEAQKIHVPGAWELEEMRTKERKRQIMSCMPAYRWEIQEKTGLSETAVENLVRSLCRENMLKERYDGLLARSWEPFAKEALSRRRKTETRRLKKILELLLAEKKMTPAQLRGRTGFPERTVHSHFSKLKKMGVVERPDHWGYRITDNWVQHVQNWISQPHIAKL